jgi:ribosomal protein S6--L-glutamate ligase
MKFALINSMEKSDYEVNRLQKVASQKGHQLICLSIQEAILCQLRETKFLTRSELICPRKFDAAVLKLGITYFESGQILGGILENSGVRCFNRPLALYQTRNKFLCLSFLAQKGFPIIKSLFMPSRVQVKEVFDQNKIITVKTNQGSGGIGVFLAEKIEQVHAIQDYLEAKKELYFIQEYIEDSFGEDIRVFVIGSKVIAAIRRVAQHKNEFRSNLFLGGKMEPIELTEHEHDIAINSSKALGLDFAGVDLIRGKEKTYILEVNGNPGFHGIEEVYDVCIPSQIFSYIEDTISS